MGAPRPTGRPASFFPKDPVTHSGRKSLLRPQPKARSRAGSSTGLRAAVTPPWQNTCNSHAPAASQWDFHDGVDGMDIQNGTDDLLSDSLDELIFGAAKTLDALKQMKREAVGNKSQSKPSAIKPASCPKSKAYWNPRADADLWTLSDMNALKWADEGFPSLSDSGEDSEGSDSDDPWDDLAQNLGFGRTRKSGATSSAEPSPSEARAACGTDSNHEEAKRMQGPMGAARSASNPARPDQRCPAYGPRQFVGPRTRPQLPRQSTQPPPRPTSSGASERARAGGFQFGTDPGMHQKQSCSAPSSAVATAAEEAAAAAARAAELVAIAAQDGGTVAECTLEMQLTACLNAAKAGGSKVLRKILKHLVLQWHPDKCHDEKQKALRTRAFQHLMKEKDRLGL